MKKTWWALTLLCSYQQTSPIFEGCHDRIIKYTVLALITGNPIQKQLVLDFDHCDQQHVDDHALAQQCAQRGYELIEANHIRLIQRPVPITGPWGTFTSTRTHCKALVTVKPLCITRPIVLEFARRLACLMTKRTRLSKRGCIRNAAHAIIILLKSKTFTGLVGIGEIFPEKYEYLLP